MTSTQTLEIFKVLNRYFKNEEDATKVVTDIELIVENKFELKKDSLATKEDIMNLERTMNSQFRWLVGIIVAVASIALAIIKI